MLATAAARTASMSSPLALPVWADDDAKYASGTMALPKQSAAAGAARLVEVSRPRRGDVRQGAAGDGDSRAAASNVAVPRQGDGHREFSEPGDYVLHVTANDYSGDGGGGEVCCWTTALVKVTVTP